MKFCKFATQITEYSHTKRSLASLAVQPKQNTKSEKKHSKTFTKTRSNKN